MYLKLGLIWSASLLAESAASRTTCFFDFFTELRRRDRDLEGDELSALVTSLVTLAAEQLRWKVKSPKFIACGWPKIWVPVC